MTKSEKLHAACVRVAGIGVLITGPSGVGKTECAFGLALRGHDFVADDVVSVRREEGDLIAAGALGTGAHIRDVGIVNAAEILNRDLFPETLLGLVVRLKAPLTGNAHPACGTEPGKMKILDVVLPCYTMVAFPGRDLPLLIEIAARHETVKLRRNAIS